MPAAAKKGDTVTALDMHTVISAVGVSSLVPLPFQGPLTRELSKNVFVEKEKAATVGSEADNTPVHIPPPGTSFKPPPPSNVGRVARGSGKVFVNGRAAARAGDQVTTCDESRPESGTVVSTTATVFFA
jgi:uncharacterized Zn-binding protein involved in type VI secretion